MNFNAVITGDFHLHPFRDGSRNGGADRLADGLATLRATLHLAEQNQVPWVGLGDFKQQPANWPKDVLNGYLAVFEEYGLVPKVVLPGQHDGVDGADGSGLRPFAKHAIVVEKPVVMPANKFWDTPVALWPWARTFEGLGAFLEDAKTAKARVILGHQFFAGSKVGPMEVRLSTGASLEQFGLAGAGRLFDFGFFGDIHKQQRIGGRGTAEVWYCGSPWAVNWGELERDKGCLLVRTGAKGTVVLPVPLAGSPQYRVVDWSAQPKPVVPLFLGGLVVQGEKLADWAGHFIKLTVSTREPAEALAGLAAHAKARSLIVIVKRETKTEKRAEVHAGMPIGTMLEEYVKVNPPPEGMNRGAVLLAGKKLLEEPKS